MTDFRIIRRSKMHQPVSCKRTMSPSSLWTSRPDIALPRPHCVTLEECLAYERLSISVVKNWWWAVWVPGEDSTVGHIKLNSWTTSNEQSLACNANALPATSCWPHVLKTVLKDISSGSFQNIIMYSILYGHLWDISDVGPFATSLKTHMFGCALLELSSGHMICVASCVLA